MKKVLSVIISLALAGAMAFTSLTAAAAENESAVGAEIEVEAGADAAGSEVGAETESELGAETEAEVGAETEAGSELGARNYLMMRCYVSELRATHDYPDYHFDENTPISRIERNTKFAIFDADENGYDELVMLLSEGIMASNRAAMFEAPNGDLLGREIPGYYIDFYKGGYVTVKVSHNQSCSDSVWPYTLYGFNKSTKKYYKIFYAHSEDKNSTWGNNTYREYNDVDKDGVIYYIDSTRMTKAQYESKVNSYIPAKNKKNVNWQYLTTANINKISLGSLPSPKLVSAESTRKGVKLTWNRVEGAEKYRVFYRNKSGGWSRLCDTYNNYVVDTDVHSGKSYTYTVRCITDNGSSYTSTYDTKGISCQYIASPEISKLENTAEGVRLTWDAVAGVARYRVLRMGSSDWTNIGTVTDTSFTDKNVSSGKTYRYTVRGIDSGWKFNSPYNTYGWNQLYIGVPKISKVENTPEGLKISWGKVSGAQKYRVFYKNKNGGWSRLGDTTSTSLVDPDVKSGKSYTYTVRCVSADGKTYTSAYDKTGKAGTFVEAPAIAKLDNVAEGIKITLKTSPGAAKYFIYRMGSSGWAYKATVTGDVYTDTAVSSGVSYSYNVRALDSNGKFLTAFRAEGVSKTFVAVPQIIKFESTAEGVKITWKKSSGAAAYRAFYKNKKGNWIRMGDSSTDFFVDSDVRNGKTYTYTVRCLDSDGNYCSAYNKSGKTYTYDYKLSDPVISKIESTSAGLKLYWGKIAGAAKYRVFYRDGSSWKRLATTSATSYEDKTVSPGDSRTYTVRCVDSNDNYCSGYDSNGRTATYGISAARASMIDYMMSHQSEWQPKKSGAPGVPAGFEFKDMDFDGLNELIVQSGGGTMGNADAVVYSYKGGRLVKADYSEDYVQNRFKVYYNTASKRYEYFGTAVLAAGSYNDHTYLNFQLTFDNNRINTDIYSAYQDIYPQNTSSGKHEYRYFNGMGGYYKDTTGKTYSVITKAQYESINNQRLKNRVDCNMKHMLVKASDWYNYSSAQKRQAIIDSYNAFSYDKH